MTTAAAAARPSAPGSAAPSATRVLHVAEPECLLRIGEIGVAAAIWRRAPDPVFAAWIDALPPERLPSLRAAMPHSLAGEAVIAACDGAGLSPGRERDLLAGDVAALALLFARAARAPMIRLRLDVVRTDSCRKFHVDNVRLRLLCTYRGPGADYGVAPRGETPDRIDRAPRGAAALFRGRRWPGETTGLVHRSPPIEGTGETRLLLVIDPFEPDDEDD
ncbi:DUF1826 domain-containing protein [Rubrimonas sp.]|uniref:DUF1826 domain-containing protein n=1 Tax=Rubrimonas sp. TaxID=2036015 RepID=UPI002FDD6E9A